MFFYTNLVAVKVIDIPMSPQNYDPNVNTKQTVKSADKYGNKLISTDE